jgi:ribosomal protein S18 acetylase RimI-like enzyme
MEYRYLHRSDFPLVHKTFQQAFADYAIDISYMTEDVHLRRAYKNGVDFGASVGAFEEREMVGYTLVGTDIFFDKKAGFDIGTGIIPAFRGKGVATGILNKIVEQLSARRFESFYLEVLENNAPAIKAYEKSGFIVTRKLICYQHNLQSMPREENSSNCRIVPCERYLIHDFKSSFSWEPSWENRVNAILNSPDNLICFCAMTGGKPGGLIIYCPGLHWMLNLTIHPDLRQHGLATALLMHLLYSVKSLGHPYLKALNIPESDAVMNHVLQQVGFVLLANQYEMERKILG